MENLTFDFLVNKEDNSIVVSKEFDAPIFLVWKTWTIPKLLDQWWAPKPWQAKTKEMSFREGGHRIYAMVGPEEEEHWAYANFNFITEKASFVFTDGFCDSEGKPNKELPGSTWHVAFTEKDDKTEVKVEIKHQSAEDLNQILEMGFEEGFTMALKNLDELLETLKA